MPENTQTTVLDPKLIRESIDYLANRLSIKKWDLSASSSKDISAQVFKGEAKQLKASQRSAITLRVWNKNNLVGITSTSDLSRNGLELALKTAYEASNYGNKKEIPDFSPMARTVLESFERPLHKSVGVTELFNRLRDAERLLLAKHRLISSIPYNGFAECDYERVYLNSDGALRSLRNTHASIYLYAKAHQDGRKPRTGGSIRIGHGCSDIDVQECINEAAEKTISHLDYEPIETGKYLICFSPEAFLELVSSFSNIFNARSIIDGTSLSTRETLGQQIASPLLNINDNGLHPSNIGGFNFDGEGTPVRNISLVENGILTNLLHSESTAKLYDVEPTGHAGIGSKVSVSPDWLIVSRTKDYKVANTLNHKKTKIEFILIENLQALHAGIKATQGSFSLPFDGWLVREGVKKSIESATIAGDIKSLLNNIVQIEEEIKNTHSGISPHVWVEGLSVTGEK
ncbi:MULTISPECIES: TldD/PmbA family protein [Prochlorococcus]|uniref:TldD/PmbA family protein n=1 Tax=Prochlorococcus TaxID=1218 RepID=UPI0005337990|nr:MULTISPECIES: TldD/PmbA family protein [Prochlorococcus]KGG12451.1 TldE/PmbA protein [Prochlorococcus sp. MIT 0601]